MSESVLLTILIVVVVGSILLGALSRKTQGKLSADVYRKQDQLFSAAELSFLSILDQAITPGQRVLGKVRLADLVSIRSGLNPKIRQIALNRVAQKHVDFVVCSGPALIPICAVELNDKSHHSSVARRRDEFLSSVCAQVGLPLLVIKASRTYSRDAIRQQLVAINQTTLSPAETAVGVS
jgi:Protein of unknown function (DUF2726)